ncbi:MAG: HAMP domain-containing sensor histidine kinase [Actinomycetota bacterium]|nr:HAMP domain-containing sensor histidine kinase [Actinomycetota bacterium]
MFKRAVIKQTAIYLLIVMGISLFFSLSIYRISSSVLVRNFRCQAAVVEGLEGGVMGHHRMISMMEDNVAETRMRLIISLLYANLFILFSAGIGSYYLALSTLRPIEEAHEAQIRFSADASHELRSPLAAMKTEIEVALRDPAFGGEEARALLQSNLEEIDKLTELSEGLLKLAEAPFRGMDKENLILSDLTREALEYLKISAKNKGIRVDSKIDDSLIVRGNRASLIELMIIVLDNAIKYSGGRKTVHIKAEKDGPRVKITIRDEGIGMSEEAALRIFDRFYRTDPSRSKDGVHGYGLGLSIAKKIVDIHQGKISVKSAPSKGSTFTIELPS